LKSNAATIAADTARHAMRRRYDRTGESYFSDVV